MLIDAHVPVIGTETLPVTQTPRRALPFTQATRVGARATPFVYHSATRRTYSAMLPRHSALRPPVAAFATGTVPAIGATLQAEAPRPEIAGTMQANRETALATGPYLAPAVNPSRWSMDVWALVRPGASGVASPVAGPTLGGSQVGTVARYRLTRATAPIAAAAYLRASKALSDPGDGELAAGLQVQPFKALPVSVHAEGRLTRTETGSSLRPAAFVTGGFDAVPLPGGLTARGYGQAGYVGGDDATAFADGQIIADKTLVRFDLAASAEATIAVGAGAWAGAQEGAARVDLGPEASVRLPVGETQVRLSVGYRMRVAGDALPTSGVAVTLAAGF